VYLAGSFSAWNPMPMVRAPSGDFSLSLPLSLGMHESKFVVDGKWFYDILKPNTYDPDGNQNNILIIQSMPSGYSQSTENLLTIKTPQASSTKPTIRFVYCTGCKWMLRTAWMMQELLSTFELEIGNIVIEPGTGAVFQIYVNNKRIWDRKENKGFPDVKVLKQMVRDEIAPLKDLGHVDRVKKY